MTHRIQPGQIYRACSPNINGPRQVRVVTHNPDTQTVTVIDYATFSGERDFPASYFHDSPYTKSGKPRRTGYALEQQ